MKSSKSVSTITSGLLGSLLFMGLALTPCYGQSTLPAYELSSRAVFALMQNKGLKTINWSSLDVHTAAVAKVDSRVTGPAQQQVDRDTNGASSVYVSEVKSSYTDTGAPVLPYPAPTDYFLFLESGDAAQAWAYMSDNGLPFVAIRTVGESTAEAAASWRTRYLIEGENNKKLYLRFPLPASSVGGIYEEDGPSEWRSRFRVDILVNGYPVWSGDSMRFNEIKGDAELERYFESFGSSLGHKDTAANANGAGELSNLRSVYLFLGEFKGGQALDVVALYRGESQVFENCEYKNEQTFCTQGTVITTPITPMRGLHFPVFYELP